MTYDQLIEHFGGQAAAATALGYDRQRIQGWKDRRRVPIEAQIDVEVKTGGALRADLPPEVRATA